MCLWQEAKRRYCLYLLLWFLSFTSNGEGGLRVFCDACTSVPQESLLKNVTWTISNLCRNKNPAPPFESVAIVSVCARPNLPLASVRIFLLAHFPLSSPSPPPPPQTLPALGSLVQHKIPDVQCDACWALSFLADGNSKQIEVGWSRV